MRRQLQALACLGTLAAMTIPSSGPAAAQPTAKTAGQTAGHVVQAGHAARAGHVVQAGQAARAGHVVQAGHAARAACRVQVARPFRGPGGTIRAVAQRAGCDGRARLRVRIMQAVRGPDRVLASDSRVLRNGRVGTRSRCSATPRRYYVTVHDHRGRAVSSRPALLFCGGRATSGPGSSARPVASTLEAAVVRLTNLVRARSGCRPLVHDRRLHRAAERHSADMAARGYFAHRGRDGRSGGDRIRAAGFAPLRSWGENLAVGDRTADRVVRGWLSSPEHRRNILNCSYTHIGVGHHALGPHWTQVFARP